MAAQDDLEDNNLLAALRPSDRELLAGQVRSVDLAAGHVLYHPGDTVRFCYFPRGLAIVSYHVVMANGSAVEIAVTGREGAVGGVVSRGHLAAFARACVMHPGRFWMIATSDLEAAKDRSAAIAQVFARYADCLLAQVFQSVACNASHSIVQRTAKWLLASVDRTGSNRVSMTQDQLGSVLGVGRTYVTRVLRRLREDGVVQTRRGFVVVSDRPRLAELACECNALVADHFDAVLAGVYPHENGAA